MENAAGARAERSEIPGYMALPRSRGRVRGTNTGETKSKKQLRGCVEGLFGLPACAPYEQKRGVGKDMGWGANGGGRRGDAAVQQDGNRWCVCQYMCVPVGTEAGRIATAVV